jgi:flagellar basal body-associated protein FliL
MSTAPPDTTSKPAKGGGMGRALFVLLAFVAGAGAGGFGAVLGSGALGLGGIGGAEKAHEEAPASAPVEYVEIENAFTSNLVDTGRYLQVRLSVSTRGGETVVAAIGQHKPALISAVLSVLGECSEADVADRVAKDKLRARLKAVLNDTLKAKGVPGQGGPGAIDEVFFTSLVVQ